MKYVWIALGVLLGWLILSLLLGKIKIRIAASATQVKLWISICGIRIWILPTKRGILKKGSDSRIVRKMRQKRKEKKEEKKAKREAGEYIPTLSEQLETVFTIVRLAQSKLQDKLIICVKSFKIEVASQDAAKTAVLYGSVVGLCSWFWEWVQASISIVQRRRGAMKVVPNFIKTQSSAEIDMILKIRTLQGLFTVFSLIDSYKEEAQKAEDETYGRSIEDEESDSQI